MKVVIDLPVAMFKWRIGQPNAIYFACVRAEIVDVAPHLADIASFAAHRGDGGYRITNIETGELVASGKSMLGALLAADYKLATIDTETMTAVMKKSARRMRGAQA